MSNEYLDETALGTIIRPEWDDTYLKQVFEAEQTARRAICGVPRKDHKPCRGKPNEDYGFYCRMHRHTGKPQPTAQEVSDPILANARTPAKKQTAPLLLNDEIRLGLTQCNVCPTRNHCGLFVPGDHCRIEERIFHRFIDTIKADYSIEPIDMFLIMPAGWRFIGMFRAQLATSRMDPIDAEASKLTWYGPRESKEFIRIMKELGLTRKERLEQEKDRLGIGGITDSTSLSEIMSAPALKPGDSVIVTQARQVTVKKGEEEDFVIENDEG